LIDWIKYIGVKTLFALFGALPHGLCVAIFGWLWWIAILIIPRLRKTAEVNLSIAYPDKDSSARRALMRGNAREMGRLLADTFRLSRLDPNWAKTHVEIPWLKRYSEVASKRGVLIATGHLGSFELLGHVMGLWGYPLAAVARRFKSPRLDNWWRELREARGNRIIDRTGAFKEIVKTINDGTSVAVLFDQNVKINHAVFVDWFGKAAATTRAFALAAIKTEAPVFVAGMIYLGDDRYRVESVECDFSQLYSDQSISDDEKVLEITKTISEHYCDMIRSFPEGWFWIHRRWKTREPGSGEKVY
jgi:KDO2-lipid IV(A) lauroyltransferase